MAIEENNTTDETPAGTPFEVRRASGPLLMGAAERLVEASGRKGTIAAREFLNAAKRHGISLDNMWCTIDRDPQEDGAPRVRHTCLAVPGEGATLMLFTSEPTEESLDEVSAVIDTVCRSSKAGLLAQTLLRPDELLAHKAFVSASFIDVGTLEYLQRPRPTKQESEAWTFENGDLGDGVTIRTAPEGDDSELLEALERTYTETLDCPELCGLRETRDVIASHRSSGSFDPAYWWLIDVDREPLGAMLFNPNPEQDAVELVYMGIAPEIRGRGIAGRALRYAMSKCAARNERLISCAVDTRNAPARALYEKHGFRRTHTRFALVRKVAK